MTVRPLRQLPSEAVDEVIGEIASSNIARATNAFHAINGATNSFGSVNAGAVIQVLNVIISRIRL